MINSILNIETLQLVEIEDLFFKIQVYELPYFY